jgi:hypothetical protein
MAKEVKFALGGTFTITETDAAPLGRCRITARYAGFTVTTEGNRVMYTMPVRNALPVQVSYVDAGGNAAQVDGDVEWASSDTSVVTVQVDADDTTQAVIATRDKIGSAQITATADADLGEGVRELITLFDVGAVAGEAVAGTIAPTGEPTPIGPEQQR